MSPENFTYWLQGFFEIQNPTTLSEIQVQEIKNHLALVFSKETPLSTSLNFYISDYTKLRDEEMTRIYGNRENWPAITC